MIEFEVKSKTQPIGKRKGQTVYFAQPVSQHHLTNKMVVDRIVRETSLLAGDVSNALISLGAIVRDAFEFEERNNIWNTPYLFNAKEFDEETGLYYYGARYYDPRVSLWISTDPEQEKNYSNTTYGYTPNPLKYIDPLGTDTLNITYSENRWKFDKPILAKGNDVFNVTINNQTESYTFSEGEYGKRVNFLNLYIGENKSDYALGIYHVSGEQENGTGYYVTPGGYPSTAIGSGRRIPEGTYPIITPASGATWRKPGVGGNVSNRGIRFHYGSGNARGWTEGCFVLSSDYTISGGKVQYNLNESKKASQNFDKILGASSHYDYKIPARNGTTKTRNGSRFDTSISHKLILKSRTK